MCWPILTQRCRLRYYTREWTLQRLRPQLYLTRSQVRGSTSSFQRTGLLGCQTYLTGVSGEKSGGGATRVWLPLVPLVAVCASFVCAQAVPSAHLCGALQGARTTGRTCRRTCCAWCSWTWVHRLSRGTRCETRRACGWRLLASAGHGGQPPCQRWAGLVQSAKCSQGVRICNPAAPNVQAVFPVPVWCQQSAPRPTPHSGEPSAVPIRLPLYHCLPFPLLLQVRFVVRLEADDWAGGAPLLAKRLAALPVVELSVPALPLQNPNSPDFDPEPAKAAASLLIKYQVGRAGPGCRVGLLGWQPRLHLLCFDAARRSGR